MVTSPRYIRVSDPDEAPAVLSTAKSRTRASIAEYKRDVSPTQMTAKVNVNTVASRMPQMRGPSIRVDQDVSDQRETTAFAGTPWRLVSIAVRASALSGALTSSLLILVGSEYTFSASVVRSTTAQLSSRKLGCCGVNILPTR
ncbi:hypothetical protein D3C73_1289610 [compost metagenome]